MAATAKRTFSLPSEQAEFIDNQVKSGGYASGSEVVRAGLRALQERDATIARWLREEVVPVYDSMKADPSQGVPIDKGLAEIRERHAARIKAGKR